MRSRKPYANYIAEYYAEMLAGTVTVGQWILCVYKIIMEGIASGEYIFDAKKANKAVLFIENFCHHSKGRDGLLKLETWQRAMVAAIFGVVDDDGLRIFREVFVVVGRKNGKTLFASAIIAYMAYIAGEYGSEIYCLAPKLEQANIVFDCFYQMLKKEPELMELAKKRRSDIYIEDNNTVIAKLAFNARKSDGFSPMLAVCDEAASWRGDAGLKQYEVMKSACGAREEPLILTISTAGYEDDGIYDELMKRSTAFLKGNSRERRILPLLYIIDNEDKWDDIEELKKANPNMGVSVKQSYLEDEIIIAHESISKRNEVKTKYANLKQNSATAWLEWSVINAAGVGYTLEDFRNTYAVAGLDLSQTTDLTAATVIIEREGVLYSFTQFFMPRDNIKKLQEREGTPYDIFVERGLITPSGGHHVDYNDVYQWFVDLREKYEIYVLQIGYDRYSAKYLIDDLKKYGYLTDEVYQGENMAPVMLEFKGYLEDGMYKIAGNNDLEKAHMMDVAIKHNRETRRFRPIRIAYDTHIDGFVSAIDAMTVRQKYYEDIGELLKNAA